MAASHMSLPETTLQQAIVNTQVQVQFTLDYTRSRLIYGPILLNNTGLIQVPYI